MNRPPTRRPATAPGKVYKPPVDPPPSAIGRAERHRWYNRAAWKRLRAVKLRSHPLCARCLERGLTTPAEHVHHVEDLADAPGLAFEAANLESLCPPCHSRETRHRQNASGDDGQIARPQAGPA
jgi:5-methylcytosine-specific restriction endonuclease McrA